MYSKFDKLDKEKKDKIINAALKEFGSTNYKNASTNIIVKDAGISKGLLFHYFNTKRELFIYLFDYCIEIFMSRYNNILNIDETDILNRLREIVIKKMELLLEYPFIFKFVKNAYLETDKEISQDIAAKYQNNKTFAYNNVFQNIDYNLFKDSIDVSKALKIIIWTFEKYGEEYLEAMRNNPHKQLDYDEIINQIDSYIGIFRSNFYK